MKKNFFLTILLLIIITSCSTHKISNPYPAGTRIGYFPQDVKHKFCYDYTGWTVFGNSEKRYDINFNFEKEVSESLIKIAKDNHYQLIIVEDVPLNDFFKFSSWSGEGSLVNDDMKKKLVKIVDKFSLDILIFPSATPDIETKEVCSILFPYHGPSKTGLIYAKQSVAVFDAKTFKGLSSNHRRGGERVENFIPDDTESLSDDEIKNLKIFIDNEINNGNRDLFNFRYQ